MSAAGPPQSGGARPPRAARVRTWLLVAVPVATVTAVAALLLSPWSPTSGDRGGLSLPEAVAGLPARAGSGSAEAVDDLASRLRRDPAVADVAVRAYEGGGTTVVLLRLSPAQPFDDRTAADLTTQVLAAAGGAVEPVDGYRSATTEDGRALITCEEPTSDSATCVAVESGEALLVLTAGPVEDVVALTERVRADVRRAG